MSYPLYRRVLAAALLLLLTGLPAAQAQTTEPAGQAASPQPLSLTLSEAIDLALTRNYSVRGSRLDVVNAEAQVREAWGQVLPQVSFSSSYTRNVKTANPFAGSEAGGIFGALGGVGWLTYNERARTDDNPNTEPLSFMEFQERQAQGQREAGIDPGAGSGGNPFGVANQFQTGVSITQALYNGSALAAIRGAQTLKDVNQLGLDRQEQVVIRDVREAFYQALLSDQQVNVAQQSMERTRRTLQDITRQVQQGVAPKLERLSAEVQLSNQQTQLVQSRNQAASARDNLKMQLGIPIDQPITLRGELEADNMARFLNVSTDDMMSIALERRPDLEQARLAIELNQVQQNITRANYRPSVSSFANFNYSGSVPDDRTQTISDPNDPFSFSQETNDFFSSQYWNPAVSVGLRVNWNLFNGFQTTARMQQDQVAIERARVQYEQLREAVRLEVETARRNLESARSRIASQEENVRRAELNYEFAEQRLAVGEANPMRLREASQQLDQSRFNFLQAVYDYLVARNALETAIGMPLPNRSELQLTQVGTGESENRGDGELENRGDGEPENGRVERGDM